jgi:hypothetical protein
MCVPDSSLKARRLGEIRTVVYGAPGYFARCGRPDHPDDLDRHRCVLRSTSEGELAMWSDERAHQDDAGERLLPN